MDEKDNEMHKESTPLLSGKGHGHGHGHGKDESHKTSKPWSEMTNKDRFFSIVTWERVKILLILGIFAFAVFLFASKEEIPADELKLIALSASDPYVNATLFPSLFISTILITSKITHNNKINLFVNRNKRSRHGTPHLHVPNSRLISNN